MSNTTRTSLITCVMLAIVQLTGCAKNVKWEEEVLLNTGETIVVSKEVRYTIKGQPGNPLDLGYLPDFEETTSFKYGGRAYTYKGKAAIIVLAISPQKLPVLLALTGRGWATRNRYSRCAKPNYVQLVPDETGQKWTWPEKIELWTYNLPANLLLDRDPPSEAKRRYTMADKASQRFMQDPELLNIKNQPARHEPRLPRD
ncbi:MAG: hypothetical protein IPG23_03955 [Burkholderiales bacterium]|nr:hypothetical protein [Burkholderiales bacterium]